MVSSSSSANQRRALEPQQVEEVLEREMETWDNPRPLRYWKYLEIYLDYMFSLFSSDISSVVMTVYDGFTSFLFFYSSITYSSLFLRSVRTLCDHSGTGAELSFQKGEELVVLGGVDHDWIRCRQGDREGLVPIGYASLIL